VPALPSVPNAIRVDILTNVGADVAALSRIHVAYSGGPPSSADATGLAAALYTIFAATLAPYMHLSDALRGVEVTDLSSPTGGQGSHTQLTIGSLAGQPLPADVCLLASMTIGRRYRGGPAPADLPVLLGVGAVRQYRAERLRDGQRGAGSGRLG